MAIFGKRIKKGQASDQAALFTLKMFSGPSMGAEISLGPGEYIVGKDISSDLILNDRSVAPKHLMIRVDDDGVHVKALAHPVYIAGKEMGERERLLESFQVVTLGTTHFALGGASATWPVIGLPTIREVVSMSTSAPGKQGEAAGSGAGLQEVARRLSHQYPWLKWLLAGWVGLLVMVLLATLGSSGGVPVKRVDRAALESLVSEMGFSGRLQVKTADDGRLTLNGYVDNDAQKRRLEAALKARNMDVGLMVWSPATLAETAQSILQAVGVQHVKVWSDKSLVRGELVMSGYVSDDDNWKKALKICRGDIPGIVAIDERAVDPIETRAQALKKLIVGSGLQEKLKVSTKGGNLVVRGVLGSDLEKQQWRQLVRRYRQLYLDEPELVETQVTKKKKLYIPIRSISIGDLSYIVTRDGRKYMVGSYLGEGYVIKEIHADRLVLERKNKTIEYIPED